VPPRRPRACRTRSPHPVKWVRTAAIRARNTCATPVYRLGVSVCDTESFVGFASRHLPVRQLVVRALSSRCARPLRSDLCVQHRFLFYRDLACEWCRPEENSPDRKKDATHETPPSSQGASPTCLDDEVSDGGDHHDLGVPPDGVRHGTPAAVWEPLIRRIQLLPVLGGVGGTPGGGMQPQVNVLPLIVELIS
jgi:hypothetical protein